METNASEEKENWWQKGFLDSPLGPVHNKRDLFASFRLIWTIHWTHIYSLFIIYYKNYRYSVDIFSLIFIDSLHAKVLKYLKLLLAIRHAAPFQRRTLTNTHGYFLFSIYKLSLSLFRAFNSIRFRFVCIFRRSLLRYNAVCYRKLQSRETECPKMFVFSSGIYLISLHNRFDLFALRRNRFGKVTRRVLFLFTTHTLPIWTKWNLSFSYLRYHDACLCAIYSNSYRYSTNPLI